MVGRCAEQKELERLYQSKQAEFLALYGRRRVGKTHLINNYFVEKIVFKHTGLAPDKENGRQLLKSQLLAFYYSLKTSGASIKSPPTNWFQAFDELKIFLEQNNTTDKQVVFIDELPWLDTPGSNFINALSYFWNNWGCTRNNLLLIACGSASSWMIDNLINQYGGLYNRITSQIKLKPFSLRECEEYFISNDINYSRYDIVQAYMAVGGIPYYLHYFKKGLSVQQNLDYMFFNDNAPLKNEYDTLFKSIFKNYTNYQKIIEKLYTKKIGFNRNEISSLTKITDGGMLSNLLNGLISSDLIEKYYPFNNKRNCLYKLIDPFCIFYLRFINKNKNISNYCQQHIDSQEMVTWEGLAFENICFYHIEQIKENLKIRGVNSITCPLYLNSNDKTVQIDMIIERNDNIVNLCEIKFYNVEFHITKDYNQKLLNKKDALRTQLNKRQSISPIIISTFGLKESIYNTYFDKSITIEDLFIF